MIKVPFKRMGKGWLAWRRLGIGGSDAPTVMDAAKKSFGNSRPQLWGEKTGRKMNRPSNFQMRRGKELEPVARRLYEKITGIPMPEVCGENETFPFIRGTFDGLNEEVRRALEIKCPGREDHELAKAGCIPKHYLWQCVHLLLVSGYEHLDYFSYLPEDPNQKSAIVSMKWDRDLEDQLLDREIEFWRCVIQDRPPEVQETKPPKGETRAQTILRMRRSR